MCTLAFAWQVFDDGFAAAATREEAYGRPSSTPAYRAGPPAVLCPRDERAGGTWFGVNEHGLFAAVTNRPADVEGERSRGLLVRDALARPNVAAASETVETSLETEQYAGFNLVLADAGWGGRDTDESDGRPECVLFTHDGTLTAHALDPGVHVVVNDGFDGETAKSKRVRAALDPGEGEHATAWRRRAGERLGDHELGACIHGENGGTVSASLLSVTDEATYEFASGPPCETAFETVEGHF